MPITTSTLPHNLFTVPDTHPEVSRDQTSGWGDIKVFLDPELSHADAHQLIATANALVNPPGKGVYATDEAPYDMDNLLITAAGGDIHKDHKRPPETECREKRKRWREVAYEATPPEYISGVIMHAEAVLDFKLATLLSDRGIIPGVRANDELAPIPRSEHEFLVQGIDDLLSKLQAARAAGARFSKWRAPIACSAVDGCTPGRRQIEVNAPRLVQFAEVKGGYPTRLALETQAETLAQFAAISQQAGLVPIVEPDVDFSRDADLARSVEVHEQAITLIYQRMRAHNVLLEGSLIKPSFPQPGVDHPSRATVTPEEIALATVTVLSRSVPTAVPGVLFLSGGLPPQTATAYLAAVNKLVQEAAPASAFARLPRLTFSYGRALQGEAMKLWAKGDDEAAKSKIREMSKQCFQAAKGIVT